MYWLNFGVDHFICCIKLLELLFPTKLIANLFYFHERITDEDYQLIFLCRKIHDLAIKQNS